MRVLLTQSERALTGLEGALRARGHDVLRWPLIRTAPLPDVELKRAVARLLACRWVLFSSPAAVRAWSRIRLPAAVAARWYGAVGPGTAKTMSDAGLRPTLVGPGDAASLATGFLAQPLAADPVGLPLGDRSRDTLERALVAGGRRVVTSVVYRTETLTGPAHGDPDAVLLASPSAVAALPTSVAERAQLIALGPTTAAAVRATGRDCRVARAPTVTAVIASLEASASGKDASEKELRT